MRYLAAWLVASLRREVQVRLEQAGASNTWQIQCVELRGSGVSVQITRAEKGCVDTKADGLKARSVFSPLREWDLLHEELSVVGHDPVFERVLASV